MGYFELKSYSRGFLGFLRSLKAVSEFRIGLFGVFFDFLPYSSVQCRVFGVSESSNGGLGFWGWLVYRRCI